MKRKSCENCACWIEVRDSGDVSALRHGRCVRFPPNGSMWSQTKPGDYCEEHKLRDDFDNFAVAEVLNQDVFLEESESNGVSN